MPGSRSPTANPRNLSVKQSSKSEIAYAFLNFSHPSEAKDQKVRRTVRSHVTRHQHSKGQPAAAAAAAAAVAAAAAASARRSNSVPQIAEAIQQPELNGWPQTTSSPPSIQPIPRRVDELHSPVKLESNSSPDISTVPSPVAPHVSLDPANLYPPEWLPYISTVYDCYIANVTHDILDTQDQFVIRAIKTLWTPFVLTNAALLHAALLIGVSLFKSPPGPQSHPISALQLKGMTISAINESLQHPCRPVSDQIIAAVLSLAQYEAFWGEAQAFSFHMRALQNMIQMRGGLVGISMSLNGLLERMVLSVDCHTSRATGAESSFDSSRFPSKAPHLPLDL